MVAATHHTHPSLRACAPACKSELIPPCITFVAISARGPQSSGAGFVYLMSFDTGGYPSPRKHLLAHQKGKVKGTGS